MRIRHLMILNVMFLVHGVYGQDTLTVEQAVLRALETHPTIEQAAAVTDAAEARVRTAESSLYPDVSIQASYANIGPLVELSIPNMGSFQFYPQNNYDAHIAARYTVTDFGRRGAAIALGKSRARTSRDAVELARTGVAMAAVRTFHAILFLQKSVLVQDEQISALNGHLESVRKRIQTGTAIRFEELTTQVRVAAARNQKADIENALQKQEAVLRQLLDAPPGSSIPIRGEWVVSSIDLNPDSLFQTATRRRVELIAAHDAEETAKRQARLSSLGGRPAVRVNLSYGSKNGYIPDLDKMRANWVAAVAAEMPIFDGGRVSRQTDEARAMLLAEQAHVRDVERQIRTDVEQSAADVQTALEKIDISKTQLDQAREAVAVARTRYETGSATNLDLLDAESAESMAKLANLQAMYRYAVSRYELDRAVGNRFWEGNTSSGK